MRDRVAELGMKRDPTLDDCYEILAEDEAEMKASTEEWCPEPSVVH